MPREIRWSFNRLIAASAYRTFIESIVRATSDSIPATIIGVIRRAFEAAAAPDSPLIIPPIDKFAHRFRGRKLAAEVPKD